MKKLFIIIFFTTFALPAKSFGKKIKFSAMGDIMFGRYGKVYGGKTPFKFVEKVFKGRDIVYGNLETPVSIKRYRNIKEPRNCRRRKCTKSHKTYRRMFSLTMYAKPQSALFLKNSGFNLMGIANNHCEDQGSKGLIETMSYLSKAGISYFGSGKTKKEAWKPFIFKKNGIKIGFISITSLYNFPPRRKGAYYAVTSFRKLYKKLPPIVKKLKPKVDFVVVALHFGEEYLHYSRRYEDRLMKKLEKAGTDVMIGTHPHVLRGVQIINKFVAFWSLGNFLFDFAYKKTIKERLTGKKRVVNTRQSGIVNLEFVKTSTQTGLKNIIFHPVILNKTSSNLPQVVKGKSAQKVLKNVLRYSRSFKNKPDELKIVGDKLVISPKIYSNLK
jgi:Bacterial capsule synthesis protein PGA_cap